MTARRPAIVFAMMGMRNAEGVAEALLHRWDCELLTWEPASSLLARRSIPHQPLLSLTATGEDLAIHEAIARLERITLGMEDRAFRDAYPKLDDETWLELQRALGHALRNDVYIGITVADAMRLAMELFDVRLVVVSEDHMRDTRIFVTLAQELGIPALQIIHSVPTGSRMPIQPVTTEHVAVYSEHTRDQYVALGARPEGIVITGNPSWDAFVRPPLPQHKPAICSVMGLDPDRPIVMYAITAGADLTATFAAYPRHHLDLAETVVAAFVELSHKHPQWQFLLRPRPGHHDAEAFEQLLGSMPEDDTRAITLDRNSPYNSVVVSDVVVNTQSNMGIEGILLGKPVVNVDIEEYGSAVYREGLGPLFDEHDAVLHARTPSEIGRCIEAALLDAETRAELTRRRPRSMRKFNDCCDGRATERVVERMLELAGVKGGSPHAFYATELALRATAHDSNRKGEAAFERGNTAEALARFTQAAALYRRDAHILNNLATAVCACGEDARAWDLIREAFHFDPCSEVVRDNLLTLGAATGHESESHALLRSFGSVSGP